MEEILTKFDSTQIQLVDPSGRWHRRDTSTERIFFTGYFWINDQLVEGENAVEWIAARKLTDASDESLTKLFLEMNGSWAVAAIGPDVTILAADIVRSIPLFYDLYRDPILVSNSSHELATSGPAKKLIEKNVDLYTKALTSFAGETIYEGLHDVAAGEFVRIANRTVSRRRYWKIPSEISDTGQDGEALAAVSNVFDSVFRKMSRFIEARNLPVFVPLSGGMDSRLLVWALKKYKMSDRIVTFSYGASENVEEARISREVAKFLDVEWLFFGYDSSDWQAFRRELPSLLPHLNPEKALPHFQDFMAVRRLKEKHGVGLMLPGLCLDGLTGLTIPKALAVHAGARFHQFFPYGTKHRADMEKIADRSDQLKNFEFFSMIHKWSSHVVHSVKTYEFLGLPFYLPYWDSELTNLWFSLPTRLRYDRLLFRRYLNRVAYIGPYAPLLKIPIALGRPQDERVNSIGAFETAFIAFKYGIKRLANTPAFLAPSPEKVAAENRRTDYLNFYSFFSEARLKDVKEISKRLDFQPTWPIAAHGFANLLALYAVNCLLREKP